MVAARTNSLKMNHDIVKAVLAALQDKSRMFHEMLNENFYTFSFEWSRIE
jgi:hypothetical protein